MAFPVSEILDNFNRADSTSSVGGNWTAFSTVGGSSGNEGLLGSQLYNPKTNFSNYTAMYWNQRQFGPDCEAYITLATLSGDSSNDKPKVYARLSVSGVGTYNGYAVSYFDTNGGGFISRADAGVETQISSTFAYSPAAGDIMGIGIVGTLITMYNNHGGTWNVVGTVGDSTYQDKGYIGWYIPGNTQNGRFDNFGGGHAYLKQSTGTATLGIGSTSVVWPQNTANGNLAVIGVTLTNAAVLGTVSSVVDSQSNVYTKAISGTISSLGDVLNCEFWYATNITGGAGSVTVNHTVDACAIYAREYSSFINLDVTNKANGSSSAANSGTSANTISGTELIVMATGDDKGTSQTWTSAGTYGHMTGTATTITGISMQDQIVYAAGGQTGTETLGASANWEALLASFFITRAVGYKTLLGVGQI